MDPLRLRLEWWLLLALALGGALLGQWAQATYRVDNRLLDFATAQARPEASSDITIVAIDERALAEAGAWPWPRSTHARLIEQLDREGAKLILYDVLFVEPTDPEEDRALAEAMAASDKVILPHGFSISPNTEAEYAAVYPLPELRTAAAGVGHVDAATDGDGVLRRFVLTEQITGEPTPHFAVAALQALGLSPPATKSLHQAPVVPFVEPQSFTTTSASEVLNGRLLDGALRDKIVLVGATAPGLGDRYPVATNSVSLMPGVETQANLLNALLARGMITTLAGPWYALLAAVALLALFLAFWFLPPRFGLLCAAVAFIAVLSISFALVPLARVWLPAGSLLLVILLAYPLWSWRRLSAVSQYLDREADRLRAGKPKRAAESGVDFIAQQVARVKRLVGNVQDSLTFLQQVINAAPDAIIVLDSNGRTQMMNGAARTLFPQWQDGDRPLLDDLLAQARATLDEKRGEIATAHGEIFLVASAPLSRATQGGDSDSEAQQDGKIIAMREVTEARRRDEERKQMLEFLSHDMRTPQVAIIGLASGGRDMAEPANALKRIRSQAERTLKLADDFVQLARLEGTAIKREDTDLHALLDEACDRFFTVAKAKSITLAQRVPDDPVFALVDASLVARMLDNLIGNAIKYSPDESTITIGLRMEAEDLVVLSVADQGPGLPPERQADPFARFGAREDRAGPSAGLGLTFVKRVAEVHSGSVEVASSSETGTCFVVRLPRGGED